ncbi:MAG: AAA family ATPase [Candidatus Marsarchaeota archaeon]|jgi:adenylate kinase|nr:AAA family ATPase [Candidatus Marsarchaeota archaeon]
MGKKIIVTGTPGSGKTAILSLLKGINIISLGTELQRKSGVERDKIRSTMSYKDAKAFRKNVLREIDSIKEDIIIDTHTSIKSGDRYIAGFTKEDTASLHDVKGIVYIDATADDILARRAADKSRRRNNETKQEIKEQRGVNISLATFYMQELGVPLYIIKNKQGKIEDAKEDVEKAIKTMLANE